MNISCLGSFNHCKFKVFFNLAVYNFLWRYVRKNCLIRYATVCSEKNIYTARRRKAPLLLRFGAFMGRRLNFSAGREYAPEKAPPLFFFSPRI